MTNKPSDPQRFSFASGTNATYIEGLYQDYSKDPNSVDPSWQKFFEGYDFAASLGSLGASGGPSSDEAKVEAFINVYRRLGHLSANLDPLSETKAIREDIRPEHHGLAKVDSKALFHPSNVP